MFAVKGNRCITHMLKLRGIETPLANVLASGVFVLREKLGPILWQLPPQLRFDPGKTERLLSLLPRDTGVALAMARGTTKRWRAANCWKSTPCARCGMRWKCAMRRKYNVALVVADTAGKWPDWEDVTADFVYIRLHGEHALYASGYEDESLARWAAKIRRWSEGKQPAFDGLAGSGMAACGLSRTGYRLTCT